MKNDNILITGGCGYIGSQLAHQLIDKKKNIIVVDNLSNGKISLCPKRAIFYKVNILNKKKISDIIKKHNINTIFHLAAHTNVGESMKNPKKYFLNNYFGTKRLLEASKNKIKFFIFSSTCAVYNPKKNFIVSEKHKTDPQNIYGLTKLRCENLIKQYSKKNNFKYAILRFFNVVGCDQRLRTGFIKKGPLINNLIYNLIKKRKYQINVFGNDYKTKDGTAIRDYIYIEDLCKSIFKIFNLLKDRKKKILLNLGYGTGLTVLEIIREFSKELKKEIVIDYKPRRKGDLPKIICDSKYAKKIINLKPITSFKKILVKSSIDWAKKNKKTLK